MRGGDRHKPGLVTAVHKRMKIITDSIPCCRLAGRQDFIGSHFESNVNNLILIDDLCSKENLSPEIHINDKKPHT